MTSPQPRQFSAGVAKVNITPPMGTPMGGYPSRTHGCTGVLKDLWLKALYMQDADGRVLIVVSAEVLFIPAKVTRQVRRRLLRSIRNRPMTVLINATHTHCGPNTSPDLLASEDEDISDYLDFLTDAVTQAVLKARDAAQPATLRSSEACIELAMHRRLMTDGRCRFAPHPQGPTDPRVRIWSLHHGETCAAVWFNYACHPTTHAGYDISPDWPGFACDAIEAAVAETTAIFTQGACGELRPPWQAGQIGTPEQARHIGERMSEAVVTSLPHATAIESPRLRTAQGKVRLPFQSWPTDQQLNMVAQSQLDTEWCEHHMPHLRFLCEDPNEQAENLRLRRLWVTRMQQAKAQPRWEQPMTLDLTLAELAPGHRLLAMAGEICFDLAEQIRHRLDQPNLAVLGYTNDGSGYIPSEKILREGGYEGGESMFYFSHPSPFAIGVEDRIVAAVKRLSCRMK